MRVIIGEYSHFKLLSPEEIFFWGEELIEKAGKN
jgi:hypothetical protein